MSGDARATPDRLDTADLLRTAQAALKERVLPHLPEDERYTGLLLAAALEIAAREAALGPPALAARRERLSALYGEAPDPAEDAAAAVARLERRLAADIRAGAFDAPGPRRDKAYEALCAAAADALAVSNPRYRIG